jgi:hypothetical protein
LLNNFIRTFLDAWRANLDFQIIFDPVTCAEYIAKYTAKSEQATQDSLHIFSKVLHNAEEHSSTLSLLQKIMLQANGLRDWAMYEIHFVNLGLSYVSTNCSFEAVCLSQNARLDLSRNKDKPRAKILCKTLRNFYANRLTESINSQCEAVFHANEPKANMSFYKFATLFRVSNRSLVPRTLTKKFEVIRTWPTYNGHSKSKQYPLHCKFQLIKYKPWSICPTNLITAFGYTNETTDSEQLSMYVQAFRDYLTEAEAKYQIPEFEIEIRNALYAHDIWTDDDRSEFHDLHSDSPNQQEEWMQISNFHQIYQDESKEEVTRSDWDTPIFHWSQHDIARMDGWIDRLPSSFTPKKKTFDDLDTAIHRASKEQKRGYDLIINHKNAVESGKTTEPLRLIIHGIAGTGKSYLLQLCAESLKAAAHYSATTGAAACIIQGKTVHSLLSLPTKPWQEKALSGNSLKNLQDKWGDLTTPSGIYLPCDRRNVDARSKKPLLD